MRSKLAPKKASPCPEADSEGRLLEGPLESLAAKPPGAANVNEPMPPRSNVWPALKSRPTLKGNEVLNSEPTPKDALPLTPTNRLAVAAGPLSEKLASSTETSVGSIVNTSPGSRSSVGKPASTTTL